jgi:hypothetical protein
MGARKSLPGYYTTAQAAAILGLTKKGTAKAARVEGWHVYPAGNANMYVVEDVYEYRDHGHRTQLAKELGWSGRGKFRNDTIDIECPKCGAFAVEWPPMEPIKFKCLDGHEGVINV